MVSLALKLTGDDAHKIRGMLAPEGIQMFSVYDFITITCTKNDKGVFARKWYGKNIHKQNADFHDEFVGHVLSLKYTGEI